MYAQTYVHIYVQNFQLRLLKLFLKYKPVDIYILNTEHAAEFFENSVHFYQTTRRYIPTYIYLCG